MGPGCRASPITGVESARAAADRAPEPCRQSASCALSATKPMLSRPSRLRVLCGQHEPRPCVASGRAGSRCALPEGRRGPGPRQRPPDAPCSPARASFRGPASRDCARRRPGKSARFRCRPPQLHSGAPSPCAARPTWTSRKGRPCARLGIQHDRRAGEARVEPHRSAAPDLGHMPPDETKIAAPTFQSSTQSPSRGSQSKS